jgi:hypothetical protein
MVMVISAYRVFFNQGTALHVELQTWGTRFASLRIHGSLIARV